MLLLGDLRYLLWEISLGAAPPCPAHSNGHRALTEQNSADWSCCFESAELKKHCSFLPLNVDELIIVGRNPSTLQFQEWFLNVEKDVNHHSNDIWEPYVVLLAAWIDNTAQCLSLSPSLSCSHCLFLSLSHSVIFLCFKTKALTSFSVNI